jgi:hypothetical protein
VGLRFIANSLHNNILARFERILKRCRTAAGSNTNGKTAMRQYGVAARKHLAEHQKSNRPPGGWAAIPNS